MSTNNQRIFQSLAAEFHHSEVRKRKQANRELSYITARVELGGEHGLAH